MTEALCRKEGRSRDRPFFGSSRDSSKDGADFRKATAAGPALAGISRDLGAPAERNPGYARVGGVIELIQARYAEPLRVEDLAQQTGLGPAQFDRLMRAIVHISPRQFVTKTRLDAACDALRESDASVGEIAHACGFYDQATFSRQFRQTTGLSPRQYREGVRLGSLLAG